MTLKLDPNSFHELEPVDQGCALLFLLYMAEKNLTLEDIMEPEPRDTNAPPACT